MNDPYKTPDSELQDINLVTRYVGFWGRTLASVVDTILLLLISWPLIYFFVGADYFTSTEFGSHTSTEVVTQLAAAVVIIVMWAKFGATPGKMLVSAKVVDAETNLPPTTGKLIIRYLGYLVSILTLFLGFLWIAWDPKKQGFHDKLAGTAVIRV